MKLSVNAFLTLDGVMQSPGAPDEDRSGGFEAGGWQASLFDPDVARIIEGEWFGSVEAFLLGRYTYQVMQPFWTMVTDPADTTAALLNGLPKYVVTGSLGATEANWANSTVLGADFLDRVRELKAKPGGELQVHGSWQLAQTLHLAGLVDVYRLLIFPVVVGAGKRLFAPDGVQSGFRTVKSQVTGGGATFLVLEPAPFTAGSYAVVDGKDVVDGKNVVD
jgi:dihydrofolate reductase